MKTVYILIFLIAMSTSSAAQDHIGNHSISSLRTLVERFLEQFSDERQSVNDVHKLIEEANVDLWDPKDFDMTSSEKDLYEVWDIEGWEFAFWDSDLKRVVYKKSLFDRRLFVVSIDVMNEQVRFFDPLRSEGDHINAGLYFVKDWNFEIISSDGEKVFSINRENYWKQRNRIVLK